MVAKIRVRSYLWARCKYCEATSTTSPALDVSDHPTTSLAHHSPVIFISRSTIQADLSDDRLRRCGARQIDASSPVPDSVFKKIQCSTDSLRILQWSSQREKKGLDRRSSRV